MPHFTLKSWNDLNTSVSSLLNSGNTCCKLAVSATNMESSLLLVSENFFFFNLSSLSGFSRHTNLLMICWNDCRIPNGYANESNTDEINTWNRQNNLQKRPPWFKSETLLNEQFAAWVRTAHGCLDTYICRTTIAMWAQVLYVIESNSKRALIKQKAVVYYWW